MSGNDEHVPIMLPARARPHTVVVTGASGRIGVPLVRGLLNARYSVHALVHAQPAPTHPLLRENVALTILDLATLSEQEVRDWLNIVHPIALIHTAALADVPRCEREYTLAYRINTWATRMLARACAYNHVHFILLSTEYVFDGTLPEGTLYREDDQMNPLNHYGRTKMQGELATQEECTSWTICRTSVVYGATQHERPDFFQWVRSTLRRNETLQVSVNQINSPTYVLDLVRMLVAVVEQQLHGEYHVSGCTPVSRYHFALSIARKYGLDETLIRSIVTSELEPGPRRPLNAALCVEKITTATGTSPMSIEEGLEIIHLRDVHY